MPAALPGSTLAQNIANPSLGLSVIFDLLSGPKGSPLDKDASGNASTGALSNGIGFGSPPIIGLTAPASILAAGFTDNYSPGLGKPDGTDSANSTIMYIGGGRCNAPSPGPGSDGTAAPNPYTTGFGIGMAGNGGSRDAGAGPTFQGFRIKTVTATGAVANGVAVETGFLNRSGVSLVTGQSVFGSATAASGVVA